MSLPPPAAPPAHPPARASVIGDGIAWLARWSLRWGLIAVGAVLLGLVVAKAWPILLPVVLALILTTVLEPPARLLERRLGFPPALAAASAVVGAIGVVVLAVVVLVPQVVDQAGEIAQGASGGLTEVERWLQDSGLNISDEQVEDVVAAAQSRLQSSAATIASGVLVGVGAVTQGLINLLLTLVLSFFFLKDGRRFLPWTSSLVGEGVGGHVTEVGRRAWRTLAGFVRTQALVGLIDAVLIGLGLVVMGVPLALPLAVLTFVGAFAPVIGALTVGVLAVLVALVSNGWVTALIIAALVLLVQQLEGNVLLPVLQGRSLNLHAGVVLLTVVLGSTLFGVAGAFLSVPTVAVVAVVGRYLNEVVAARAGEPAPDTPEEASEDSDVEAAVTEGA